MTFFEYNTPHKIQEQDPVRLMSSIDDDDREEERISALQEEASNKEEDNLDWEMLLDEDDSSLSDSEGSNHNFSVELENTPHAGFDSILDALETNSLTLVRGVRRSNPTTRNISDIPGDISIDDSQDFVDYTYTMPSDDAGEDNERNSRSRQESSRPRRPRSNWRRSHHRRSISSRRRLPKRSIVVSE